MEKILIVDDDPIVVKSLSEFLREQGYDVRTAIDGYNGLVEIERNTFDLIISDVMMPNLTGLTLLSLTKEFHHSIPIIFISSLTKADVIAKSIGLQPDDFLVKPIELEKLSEMVKRLLNKQ